MIKSSTLCKFLFLSFTRSDPAHQFRWLSPTGKQLYPHPQGTGWCTLKGPPRPGHLPGDRPVAQTPVPSRPTLRTPGQIILRTPPTRPPPLMILSNQQTSNPLRSRSQEMLRYLQASGQHNEYFLISENNYFCFKNKVLLTLHHQFTLYSSSQRYFMLSMKKNSPSFIFDSF